MALLRTFHAKDLTRAARSALTKRAYADDRSAFAVVEEIVSRIEAEGEKAVLAYTEKFDGVRLESLVVPESEIKNAAQGLDPALRKAFEKAAENIEAFHELQKAALSQKETTISGTRIGFRYTAVEGAAVYAPGGKALYPSSVLMGLIPARIAGADAILVTPPDRSGSVHPAVLFAAQLAGARQILRVGGAQGVAAAALGVGVPACQVIVGPGNRFVTAARAILAARGIIRPDVPAGPSEVIVIADDSANPAFVASDLLSQAEHGEDSPCILLTASEKLAALVVAEVEKGIADRPERAAMKSKSIREHSFILLCRDLEDAFDFSNEYAPEHLEICTRDASRDLEKVKHAGSVFLGNYAPVALGDYFSGTNHVLPTAGGARLFAGLGVDTFMKRLTFQEPTKESLRHALEPILLMSRAEGLEHEHGHSVAVRFKDPKDA